MKPNRPLHYVPRRALNSAVIVGGVLGIILQAGFGWNILTTFLITLGLCGLCVGLVAMVCYRRR